jgi:hypothetical protein
MNFTLAAIFLALNVIDAILTDEILANGGREKNPVMAWLMAQPLTSPFRWAIKMVFAVGIVWLCWPHAWALALACVPFVWVVWHNWQARLRQMEKA